MSKLLGLGTDLVEITRVQKSIERHGKHFLDRIFTEKEQNYCLKFKNSAPHFAGRFAAKEAVAKALGTGFGKDLSWQDVNISSDERGKPQVFLSQEAQKRFEDPQLIVSISHSESHAMAVALYTTRG